MNKSKDKWGLVFAGGGGKGAYEIGAWKALNEYGKIKISAVSGTSVGALNAVLFAAGDYNEAEKIWLNISNEKIRPIKSIDEFGNDILNKNYMKMMRSLNKILDFSYGFDDILENPLAFNIQDFFERVDKLSSPYKKDIYRDLDFGLASRKGLSDIINNSKAIKKITPRAIPCFATCTNVTKGKAECFCLNNYDCSKIKRILLASSAIPLAFNAVYIGENQYWDGGLKDNVPIKPLYNIDIRNIIVVHLRKDDVISEKKYPNARIIHVIPSKDLGQIINGTMDFDSQNARKRMQLGYDDTMKLLKEKFGPVANQVKKKEDVKSKNKEPKATAVVKPISKTQNGSKTTKVTENVSKKSSSKKETSKYASPKQKIIFEFDGKQIDYKTIEKKAAKLGGDVYIVASEKKIYNENGKSVDLF